MAIEFRVNESYNLERIFSNISSLTHDSVIKIKDNYVQITTLSPMKNLYIEVILQNNLFDYFKNDQEKVVVLNNKNKNILQNIKCNYKHFPLIFKIDDNLLNVSFNSLILSGNFNVNILDLAADNEFNVVKDCEYRNSISFPYNYLSNLFRKLSRFDDIVMIDLTPKKIVFSYNSILSSGSIEVAELKEDNKERDIIINIAEDSKYLFSLKSLNSIFKDEIYVRVELYFDNEQPLLIKYNNSNNLIVSYYLTPVKNYYNNDEATPSKVDHIGNIHNTMNKSDNILSTSKKIEEVVKKNNKIYNFIK